MLADRLRPPRPRPGCLPTVAAIAALLAVAALLRYLEPATELAIDVINRPRPLRYVLDVFVAYPWPSIIIAAGFMTVGPAVRRHLAAQPLDLRWLPALFLLVLGEALAFLVIGIGMLGLIVARLSP